MKAEHRSPHFLQAVDDIRQGNPYDFSVIPPGLDRDKHERFIREFLFLNVLFPTKSSIPGYDDGTERNFSSQCSGIAIKMNDQIAQGVDDEKNEKLVLEIAELLKGEDKNRVRLLGPKPAVRFGLQQTVDLSIQDMRAFINTFVYERGFDKKKVLASYPVISWFSRMHGNHDPQVKEFTGRVDDVGDSMRYDEEFVVDLGFRFDFDRERVDAYASGIDTAKTSTLGCPAGYTTILPAQWANVVEAYERCMPTTPSSV